MKKIVAALFLMSSAVAFAQTGEGEIGEANARCEAARQQKLEPIRERKIAQCKRSAHQPTAGCETYYSTYGNNSNHANGSVVRGQFYDLPECAAARRAALPKKQDF